MSPAEALLADLRSRGIDLETDGERLRWRPYFLVSAPLAEKVRGYKGELIRLLSLAAHPRRCLLGHWLDGRGRCWRCCDRDCSRCGRPTGSAFIELCAACGRDFNGNRGEPL
jgi:hypothetical protein